MKKRILTTAGQNAVTTRAAVCPTSLGCDGFETSPNGGGAAGVKLEVLLMVRKWTQQPVACGFR